MAETPCQKCRAERDRYRKEAAELRMARENDGKRWKVAVEREHARAEALAEALAEGIAKTDEELEAIKLAQVIIATHNENVARQQARVAELEAQVEGLLRLEQRAFRMALLWKRVAKKSRRLAYNWFRAATGRETGKP